MPTYQQPPAEVHETHVGVVFLLRDRAYKFKKPVDLGFVDFSTAERRQAACRREVDLNRRMSPDVYLGVAQLHQPDGTSEPVVSMRRMREEERLSTLVAAEADVRPALRQLARELAALHGRSRRDPAVDREGGRGRLLARWTASFEQVREFEGTLLDGGELASIERCVRRYLAGRAGLFDSRVRTGCIVDGHGDLIADDVYCTPDGPRALDCLEFDDRLRYLDRIDDAAFLAMDLERLGAPEEAQHFLDSYQEFAGDTAPDSLVHHYLAYRAFVRAKVACLQHAQGDPAAGRAAAQLTALTHEHLTAHEVTLTLVGGPPGTGKTTLAAGVADRVGHVLLSSDRIRKETAGLDPTSPAPADWRSGLYAPEWTERTYAALLSRAEALLGRGESVILDASWTDARHRELARQVAVRSASLVVEIRCECGEGLADQRLLDRAGSASDADPEIARRLRAVAAPWPEAVPVDTSGDLADAVARAAACLPQGRRFPRPARRRPQLVPD